MRTSLSIDDDVLYAVKRMAQRQGRSAGEVLSDLARRALQASADDQAAAQAAGVLYAQLATLSLVPYRAPLVAVVTQAQIEALREVEGV
jgi:metal-responsive CopG/Arc/MetJ family transcriptional regulator